MLQLLADMQNWLAGFRNDEHGATAVEYGLIVALIAAIIIAIVATLGEEIAGGFQSIVDEL